MQAISDQAGIAVLTPALYAESQRQARVMTALAATQSHQCQFRLDDVLQRILNETIQALQVETVALALVESNWDLVFTLPRGSTKMGSLGSVSMPGWVSSAGWPTKARA